MNKKPLYLYMSLWGEHGGAPGLALFRFDAETGAISLLRKLDDSRSFGPSVIDAEKRIFYVCNETDLEKELGYNTGRIYGFRIDPSNGELTELFRQETYCPFPDYIGFSADKKYMLVPHHSSAKSVTTIERDTTGKYSPVVRYMDSAVDLFTMQENGTIDELVDVRKHSFSRRTTDYQGQVTIPHPHCAVRSPSGKLFAVCDKGDCHLYLYEIDRSANRLNLLSRTMTDVPLSEPRYCVFHPTKPYLFVNHEHSAHGQMTVSAFRYDENGNVTLINKVNCVPQGKTANCGQGLCISPDGNRIYNQLNGCNTIAVLAVNEDGSLTVKQHAVIEGAKPRNCNLSPDGRFLVSACLSGEIAVYAVDPDGCLTLTDHKEFMEGSAYITFYQP
ncbi:MAG: beta-propeller fold lactonase family protein [Faecalibacterium sp.]|nr:beta-propeller fold lactonase family protein [Faecalibacterium sp.]